LFGASDVVEFSSPTINVAYHWNCSIHCQMLAAKLLLARTTKVWCHTPRLQILAIWCLNASNQPKACHRGNAPQTAMQFFQHQDAHFGEIHQIKPSVPLVCISVGQNSLPTAKGLDVEDT